MLNEKRLRLAVLAAVALAHILMLLFFVVNMSAMSQAEQENARVMKVTDLDEEPPPPPEEDIPVVEAIAEEMIETDTEPVQTVVAPGTLTASTPSWDDYLQIHLVSDPPKFDEREISSALVYPPIALRSSIEGRVILELFVDKNGYVQQVRIMMEDPPDRGFGEAAVKAFTGRRGTPAMANGEPVSARYRYPVSFRIK
ncbi:MAG: energy transducer TonB [Treponema sp.]|nr:energy transducer TonB [Treponema sp.]